MVCVQIYFATQYIMAKSVKARGGRKGKTAKKQQQQRKQQNRNRSQQNRNRKTQKQQRKQQQKNWF